VVITRPVTVIISVIVRNFSRTNLSVLWQFRLLIPYSMERSPWEANRFSASQEVPRILWNPKIHYRLHKCSPHVQVRGLPYEYFLTWYFSRWGVVSTSPNPWAGGPPLVGFPLLLIQYIRSYRPYWRPFAHSQSEDAPCRGDLDPLTTGQFGLHHFSFSVSYATIWAHNKTFRCAVWRTVQCP
jgi:hypothetical protein